MLGIWAATVQSVQGAIMVDDRHGISTGALFLLVGMLYERRHTRMIADFGGVARAAPSAPRPPSRRSPPSACQG